MEAVLEYLKEKMACIDALIQQEHGNVDFLAWRSEVRRLLERVFGQKSSYYDGFCGIRYASSVWFSGMEDDSQERYVEGLQEAKQYLSGIIDEVECLGMPATTSTKNGSKPGQVISVTQNQSMHGEMRRVLEDQLTVPEWKALQGLLKEADSPEKEEKIAKFITILNEGPVVKILTGMIKIAGRFL